MFSHAYFMHVHTACMRTAAELLALFLTAELEAFISLSKFWTFLPVYLPVYGNGSN